MGNDLVRFIDVVIGRPTIVSGLSSGGVLAAWLSAYAKPGQIVAAHYEDPPLYASQVEPAVGPGIRQGIGAVFRLWSTYLGDQWSIGDWDGMPSPPPRTRCPAWLTAVFPMPAEPPQTLREYDPEWGRAFWTGTVAASCDHDRMLRAVKVPVLFTHHFRHVDPATGLLMGASSDTQAGRVRELLVEAGVAGRLPLVRDRRPLDARPGPRSCSSTPSSTGPRPLPTGTVRPSPRRVERCRMPS